ncbi:hypothetical protein [Pelagibaculum spongiae]|uniref:Uncharacterized protein n=1 Tax=Pelagibaculum spongiae TaxID=2080658 RepID=A0A2V1GR24_9GAMM|nr:hypothetical protein [Pelagibaculum spongiae]PVZ64522.1 hypothetical protein DC094_19620 [Pelagibaculum spongiae]
MDNNPAQQAKIKCFGSKAALCAEATRLPKIDLPTINLEVAPRYGEKVEWRQKIVIQLSDSELPIACAVLMGYLPNAHFKRPGKGIDIERQENRLLIRASAGTGNLFMLPVTIGDSFRLCTIMLRQLVKQTGLGDETLVLAALRGAAALNKPQVN